MSMFNKGMKIGEGKKYDMTQVSNDGITAEELNEIARKNKKLIDIYKALGATPEGMSQLDLALAMDDIILNADNDHDGKLSGKELKSYAQKLENEINAQKQEGEAGVKVTKKDVKAFIKSLIKAQKGDDKTSTQQVVSVNRNAQRALNTLQNAEVDNKSLVQSGETKDDKNSQEDVGEENVDKAIGHNQHKIAAGENQQINVGGNEGILVGDQDGDEDKALVGDEVGDNDGTPVGDKGGDVDGITGDDEGRTQIVDEDGDEDEALVGDEVGDNDGTPVGDEGETQIVDKDGDNKGTPVGNQDGTQADDEDIPPEVSEDELDKKAKEIDTLGVAKVNDKIAEAEAARKAQERARIAEQVRAQRAEVRERLNSAPKLTWTEKNCNIYEDLALAACKAAGVKPTKIELEERIKDLKALNPNIKDGEIKGKRIVARSTQATAQRVTNREAQRKAKLEIKQNQTNEKNAKQLVKDFYGIACDNSGNNSMAKMKKFIDTHLNNDNVVDFLTAYKSNPNLHSKDSSIIDTIQSEWSDFRPREDVYNALMDKLASAAKAKGIDKDIIAKAKKDFSANDSQGKESALDFLVGQIKTTNFKGKVDNVKAARAATNFRDDYKAEVDAAQDNFETARAQDGWTAKAGDWILGKFGCKTEKDLRDKLGDQADAVQKLMNCKTYSDFTREYKNIFKVPFNPRAIAAKEEADQKLYNAGVSKSGIDACNTVLGAYNNTGGKIGLDPFVSRVCNNFKYEDKDIQAIFADYAERNNIKNPTDEDKKTALLEYVKNAKQKFQKDYTEITKGESLEKIASDAEDLGQVAYGTTNLAKEVDVFNANMMKTEMAGELAAEVVGTIALQAIPVAGQAAMGALAARMANMGAKGAKMYKFIKAGQEGFKAVNTFQKGERYTGKMAAVKNYAAKTVTAATAATTATTAVDLSNGKSVEAALEKGATMGAFAGVGATAASLAPVLTKALHCSSKVATEIAENAINTLGVGTIEALNDSDATKQTMAITALAGFITARASGFLSKGKGAAAKTQANTPNGANAQGQARSNAGISNNNNSNINPANVADEVKLPNTLSTQPRGSVTINAKQRALLKDKVDELAGKGENATAKELLEARRQALGAQNVNGESDRLIRQLDEAAENLAPAEKAAYEQGVKQQLTKEVDHAFEKPRSFNSTDAKTIAERAEKSSTFEELDNLEKGLRDVKYKNGAAQGDISAPLDAINKNRIKLIEACDDPAELAAVRETITKEMNKKAPLEANSTANTKAYQKVLDAIDRKEASLAQAQRHAASVSTGEAYEPEIALQKFTSGKGLSSKQELDAVIKDIENVNTPEKWNELNKAFSKKQFGTTNGKAIRKALDAQAEKLGLNPQTGKPKAPTASAPASNTSETAKPPETSKPATVVHEDVEPQVVVQKTGNSC